MPRYACGSQPRGPTPTGGPKAVFRWATAPFRISICLNSDARSNSQLYMNFVCFESPNFLARFRMHDSKLRCTHQAICNLARYPPRRRGESTQITERLP